MKIELSIFRKGEVDIDINSGDFGEFKWISFTYMRISSMKGFEIVLDNRDEPFKIIGVDML
jgi:hypothetical protein